MLKWSWMASWIEHGSSSCLFLYYLIPFPVLSCVSNQLYRLVVLALVSSMFYANGLSKVKISNIY